MMLMSGMESYYECLESTADCVKFIDLKTMKKYKVSKENPVWDEDILGMTGVIVEMECYRKYHPEYVPLADIIAEIIEEEQKRKRGLLK